MCSSAYTRWSVIIGREITRYDCIRQDKESLYKRSESQSTFSVKFTGCLNPRQYRILIHNFKNNEDNVTKSSMGSCYLRSMMALQDLIKVYNNSIGDIVCTTISQISKFKASSSEYYVRGRYSFWVILMMLAYFGQNKVSLLKILLKCLQYC